MIGSISQTFNSVDRVSPRDPRLESQQTPIQQEVRDRNQSVQRAPAKVVEVSEEVRAKIEDRRSTKFNITNGSDGKPVVQVLDKETDEVLVQLPPEQIINQSKRFREYMDRVASDLSANSSSLPSGSIVNIKA